MPNWHRFYGSAEDFDADKPISSTNGTDDLSKAQIDKARDVARYALDNGLVTRGKTNDPDGTTVDAELTITLSGNADPSDAHPDEVNIRIAQR